MVNYCWGLDGLDYIEPRYNPLEQTILQLGYISQCGVTGQDRFTWAKIITNPFCAATSHASVAEGRGKSFAYFLAQRQYTICVVYWEIYPNLTILVCNNVLVACFGTA